jgi:putative Mg2+ transporter-C (MgtC) family protein
VRDLSTTELVVRLAVAAFAAVLIGLERELRGHPAGVRTHALVAVGSAMFTIAGAYGFADLPHGPNVDPARIAAQVASGIGFLGAGAILRQGMGVRGLTTAATLWIAAAVGVTSGAGAYAAVLAGTVLMLLLLVLLRLAKPLLHRLAGAVTVVEMEYEGGHGTLGQVMTALADLSSRLDHFEIDEGSEEGLRRVSLYLSTRDVRHVYAAVDAFRDRPEVRSVRVTGPAAHTA